MTDTPNNRRSLFTTGPHGEHHVALLEDASKADDCIYEIRDRYEDDAQIRILGSELASLCQWWAEETNRPCDSPEEEEEAM